MTFDSFSHFTKSGDKVYRAQHEQLTQVAPVNPAIGKFKPHSIGGGRQKIVPRPRGDTLETSKKEIDLNVMQEREEGEPEPILEIEENSPLPATDEFNVNPQLLKEQEEADEESFITDVKGN